jgi:hypothetical protein
MDRMSLSTEAPPQAGIKPCGYLRCLILRSKRGRKSVGMWHSASTSSARGSRNSSTPSMPDTLNQKRHQRPAVDESRRRYPNEAAFGCFMSPSGSLPECRFSLGIEQKYQRCRLSSCFFFEGQVAASSTHRRTCGRCSVSERRLSAFHSLQVVVVADCHSVSERRLSAFHSVLTASDDDPASVSERRLSAFHS